MSYHLHPGEGHIFRPHLKEPLKWDGFSRTFSHFILFSHEMQPSEDAPFELECSYNIIHTNSIALFEISAKTSFIYIINVIQPSEIFAFSTVDKYLLFIVFPNAKVTSISQWWLCEMA